MDTCPPRASVSAVNISQHHQPRSTANSPTASPDMHHRPLPTVRSLSSLSPSVVSSRVPTPRHSPLLPSFPKPTEKFPLGSDYQPVQQQLQPQHPSICGLPLKYVSLVTLAVQNAALSIVMHYSRVSTPPALAYSPASAVLLNELLKGSISFFIALLNSPLLNPASSLSTYQHPLTRRHRALSWPAVYWHAFADLCGEVFSPDAWKLSIPAILYVIQNSLQFVAIANLPVASFQVTYQMKILTTAAFSVALLRRKLSTTKWLSLFFLAIGVGIVQIQTTMGGSSVTTKASSATEAAVGSAHEYHMHTMNPLKGFGAVTAACFTSGLAGVYFEMVLKGSKADLWVRNVQLSLFSLIPALLPILYAAPHPDSRGFLSDLFRHFGGWAWATVAIQVVGGLVTAVVIKYSDNILKGFATSLSIVLSFLASVALFDFHITPSFVIGASTVLGATWMYNQPAQPCAPASASTPSSLPSSVPSSPKEKDLSFSIVLNDASPTSSGKSSPSASPYYPSTPLDTQNTSASASVLGLGVGSFMRRKSGGFSSSRNSSTASLSALLSAAASSHSLALASEGSPPGRGTLGLAESGELVHPPDGLRTADGTPFSSKPPSRLPSRASTPCPSPTAPTHFAPGFGPFARSASGERMGNGAS